MIGRAHDDVGNGRAPLARRRGPMLDTSPRRCASLALAALLCSCARAPTPTISPEPSSERHEIANGDAILAAHGLPHGTFVLRTAGQPDRVLDPALARTPYLPASTFKIANTLIGLETGVIPDASFSLPWDGQERGMPDWNRDHTLASAMEVSAVWWYQEVARRIGIERMREWVARLGYGNGAIGEDAELDTFWLNGPLRITALQQVDFVQRLTSGALPVSARSASILRDVMPSRTRGASVVRAKTGTATDDVEGHAWLVGWVEREGVADAWFALLVPFPGAAHMPSREARWDVVMDLLAHEGVIPSE